MGSPEGRAKCAKTFLIIVNGIAVILSLAVMIFALVVLFSDTSIAIVSSFPTWIFYVIIAFNGFVFLISILGFIAGTAGLKVGVIAFAGFSTVTILVQIIAMIFALLYANGISVGEGFNDFARTLQDNLEDSLVAMAISSPTEWLDTVRTFKCCGVDFEANYQYLLPKYASFNAQPNAFVDALQVDYEDGACAAGRQELYLILAEFPVYNSTAAAVAESRPVIGSEIDPYFCKQQISDAAQSATVYIAVVLGVLILVQIASTAAAYYLLCGATVSQGGFKAERKGAAAHDVTGMDGEAQYNGNEMKY